VTIGSALRRARRRMAGLLLRGVEARSAVDTALEALAARDDLANRDRALVERMRRERVFRREVKRCRLRRLPLAAILPGTQAVAVPLAAVHEETGHPNHVEMLYVVAGAVAVGARDVFEFGTFVGRTTYHLAQALPEASVTTLDLPRDENPYGFADRVGEVYRDTPEAARIRELRVNALAFDPEPERSSYDFIWVDGDHSYEGVRNDTEKALALLRPGGTIMWHDFSPDSPGLVEYMVDLTRELPLFWIRNTSVLMHRDGVDPLGFEPAFVPHAKMQPR
jgi:predicted O-methyltransferase YrrM